MRFLLLSLILFSTLASQGAPLCENIFSENRTEEQFTHYSQVLALEAFKPREIKLALELIAQTGVGSEKFMYRYKDLWLLTTNEIAMAAPPEALLRLSAVSLSHGFDVARVKLYLGVVLLQTKGYSKIGERTYRQQLPHRIHLALTEIAIRSGQSPGDIAFTYNENLQRIASEPRADEFSLPIDLALIATRKEILKD